MMTTFMLFLIVNGQFYRELCYTENRLFSGVNIYHHNNVVEREGDVDATGTA